MSNTVRNIRDLGFILFVMTLLFSVALGKDLQDSPQPSYVVKVITPIGKHRFEGKMQDMTEIGTGSIIRYDLVLTCEHVIHNLIDGRRINITYLGGPISTATVIKSDSQQDLALLKIPDTLLPILKISGLDPMIGDTVKIGGFANGEKYKILTGEVVKWYLMREDGEATCFEVNKQGASGMSGGPVINRDRKMAGIIFGAGPGYSMCPNAVAIRNFLKGFDLSEMSGTIE